MKLFQLFASCMFNGVHCFCSADGQPVAVKTPLEFQFKSVIRDLEFSEWNSKYIRVFIHDKLDPVSFGSSQTRHGLWVGVPEYFQQSTTEGIMKTNILVSLRTFQNCKKNTVNWLRLVVVG